MQRNIGSPLKSTTNQLLEQYEQYDSYAKQAYQSPPMKKATLRENDAAYSPARKSASPLKRPASQLGTQLEVIASKCF